MRLMFSSASSFSYSSLPNMRQRVAFVMSSFVGPSPPVTSTTSLAARQRLTAASMASPSSPMVQTSATAIPAAVSALDM